MGRQRRLVVLSVIVTDGDEGALDAAVAALRGCEFPGVPSSWVSQTRTGPSPGDQPTGARGTASREASSAGTASSPARRDDGRTDDEAAYEDGVEDGSIET